jgi:CBS domain-containing protein
MTTTQTTTQATTISRTDMIRTLKAAKENARLQIHLLSVDAKQRWHELEGKLESLETRLGSAEPNLESLFDVAGNVRDLTRAVREIVREGVGKMLGPDAPVSTLLTSTVYSCSPRDSLAHAARLLWENDCGALFVTDNSGALVGVITDRDICMASYTRGARLDAMLVESTMSSRVHSIQSHETLSQLAALMTYRQVRRVPVVEHGRLVGVVSLADLAQSAQDSGNASWATLVCCTLANISKRLPA